MEQQQLRFGFKHHFDASRSSLRLRQQHACLTRNQTMSTRSPIITGGPFSSITIQPALPLDCFLSRPTAQFGAHHHESSKSSYMVRFQINTEPIPVSSPLQFQKSHRFLNTTCLMCLIVSFPSSSLLILTVKATKFRMHPAAPGIDPQPATGILSGILSVDAVSTVHAI